MLRSSSSLGGLVFAGLVGVVVCSGCKGLGGPVAPGLFAHNPTKHQRLEIIYTAHAPEGVFFSETNRARSNAGKSNSSVKQVAFTANEPEAPQWSIASLSIRYPHPAGKPETALVMLELQPVDCGKQCQQRSLDEARHERYDMVWERRLTYLERMNPFRRAIHPRHTLATVSALEIPYGDLERLLHDLEEEGFFTTKRDGGILTPQRPDSEDGPARLEVRCDRRWTAKSWHFEPLLDELLMRVTQEGHPLE